MKKIMSFVLTFVMLITPFSLPIGAYAASKPSTTSITSVSAKSSSITVKWKKKSCTGYQIQYSTSSKFKSAKTVKITKSKTTSKTISKLKSGKKYYVMVRTYKKSGKKTLYSKWSKAKSVTTKKSSSNSSSELTVKSNPTSTYRVNKITINWKKQNVDGYEVEYDISKKFNTNDSDFHKTFDIKATSKNGKNATKSFNFDNYDNADMLYVRIRTYKKYYDKDFEMYLYKYSSWSKVATVKLTKCADDAIAALDKAYAQMNITSDMSDLQKIAQIQKWIDANWHYNQKAHNVSCSCEWNEDSGKAYVGTYCHFIATEGYGGCQSFAYSFRYFSNKAGIPCEVLNGTYKSDGEGHYWNYVKVEGYWYHYDCEKHKQIDLGIFRNYFNDYNLSNDSVAFVNANEPVGNNYVELNNKLSKLKSVV